jgi:hypothetical protein
MLKVKLAGIYIIEIDDYYYIGKSVDVFSRWSNHYTSLKLNRHHSPKLQEKFNENKVTDIRFKVLEYVSLSDWKKTHQVKGKTAVLAFSRYLSTREREWMSKHSINYCLNNDDKYFSK